MPEIKSIKHNFIMNCIFTASAFIFPLITFPYASRILNSDGIGRVSFVTSVVTYFSIISMMGIPTYGIRACAQVRNDKEALSRTVHEILIINMGMGIFSYICLFLSISFIDKLSAERELFIIMSTSILFNIIGVEWLYKGLEQYSYITIRSIIFKAISVVLLFFIVKAPNDYAAYGVITMIANLSSNIFNFINLRKYITIHPLGNYHFRQHIKAIAVFFSMSIAVTIYADLDVVMLGFLSNSTQVGYYNAAVKIKNLLLSIVASLGAVLLPRVSYYVEQKMFKEFDNIIDKSFHFTFLIATPLIVYFILFARECILLLSGEKFLDSVIPMQILLPTVLLIGITNVIGFQIFVPLGLERIVLYSQCCGALTDLFFNTILIPRYLAKGAAIGTLITEIVVFLVQLYFLKKNHLAYFKNSQYKQVLPAVIISSILCIILKPTTSSAFFVLCISAIVFFCVYFIVLYLSQDSFVVDFVQKIVVKLKTSRLK